MAKKSEYVVMWAEMDDEDGEVEVRIRNCGSDYEAAFHMARQLNEHDWHNDASVEETHYCPKCNQAMIGDYAEDGGEMMLDAYNRITNACMGATEQEKTAQERLGSHSRQPGLCAFRNGPHQIRGHPGKEMVPGVRHAR